MGVTLRDARDLGNPGAPIRDPFFIATTNIESWLSGPASAAPPNDSQYSLSLLNFTGVLSCILMRGYLT